MSYIKSVINDFNESINYHTSRVATSGLNSTSTSLSTLQILINSHTLKVCVLFKQKDNFLSIQVKCIYIYIGGTGFSFKWWQSFVQIYRKVSALSILKR